MAKRREWQSADGTVTSVEVVYGRGGPIYTVSFNYKVGEHWYGGVFTGNEEYKVDDLVALRYDPNDPDRNDLAAQEHRRLIVGWMLIGAAVVIVLTVFVLSLLKG